MTDLTSIDGLLHMMASRRRHLAQVAMVAGFVSAVVALVMPAQWTTSARMITANRRAGAANLAGLGGLAAQLGVAIPGTEPAQVPAFFVDLVHTAEVLTPVLYQSTGEGRIVDALTSADADSALRELRGLDVLRRVVSPTFSARTGIVTITVATRAPALSFDITREVLASLDRTYRRSQQTQAMSERQFTEARLSDVRASLRSAEEAQRRFLQVNRSYTTSAELRLEFERLAREVGLQQAVYTTLAQALEQARIEEVRDTPVLSVIDSPRLAARPASRYVIVKTIAGAVAGLVLALAWMLTQVTIRSWNGSRQQASPASVT